MPCLSQEYEEGEEDIYCVSSALFWCRLDDQCPGVIYTQIIVFLGTVLLVAGDHYNIGERNRRGPLFLAKPRKGKERCFIYHCNCKIPLNTVFKVFEINFVHTLMYYKPGFIVSSETGYIPFIAR